MSLFPIPTFSTRRTAPRGTQISHAFTSLSLSRTLPGVLGLGFAMFSMAGTLSAREIYLTDPAYGFFHANAMDQPRLYALLTDEYGNPIEDQDGPVIFRAFIDTGSSGTVISNLHVAESEYTDYGVRSFGWTENDFVGEYTNLGIGGPETGWVTREFGIQMLNHVSPFGPEPTVDDFVDYGHHRLWTRQQPGIGEVMLIDVGGGWIIPLVSPVNIIGMPAIEQRTMVMEWKAMEGFEGFFPPEVRGMETRLLPAGDPGIPEANVVIDLEMRNFVEATGEEILPSASRNPLVPNVTVSHDPNRESATSDWLFDTGAGSSFISLDFAQTIGLIPDSYQDLESFVIDHQAGGGMISQIGGIGPIVVTVPILEVNEIRVPARDGIELVWENVRILVFEHPELAELGLEGIFGMNLVGPAATIDATLLEGIGLEDGTSENLSEELLALLLLMLSDVSPTPFESIVFEVTGEETAELRLFTKRIPSFDSWKSSHFSAGELEDETVSGIGADPDGYGIPNLLRFAFGMDPRQPQRDRLPRGPFISDNPGSDPFFAFEFRRHRNDMSLEFVLEGSTDLANWDPLEAELSVAGVEGDYEIVEVRTPVGNSLGAARFFRIRARLVD